MAPPSESPAQSAQQAAVLHAAQWVGIIASVNVPASLREPAEKCSLTDREKAFAAWLRSGEVLCAVVNKLRPGCVRSVAKRSSQIDATGGVSPFEQMENISHYLQACRALGVPAQDLFDTSDLYDAHDVRAVVRNLHSLGRIAQRLPDFEGPALGARLASKNERQFSAAQLLEARGTPKLWNSSGYLKPTTPTRGGTAAPAPAPAPAASDLAEEPAVVEGVYV